MPWIVQFTWCATQHHSARCLFDKTWIKFCRKWEEGNRTQHSCEVDLCCWQLGLLYILSEHTTDNRIRTCQQFVQLRTDQKLKVNSACKTGLTTAKGRVIEGAASLQEPPEGFTTLPGMFPCSRVPAAPQSLWRHWVAHSWVTPLKGEWPFFMFNDGRDPPL